MRRLRICRAAAAALTVLLLSFVARAQIDAQQLWRHRNLGKALFETPTTVSEAPAELKKALVLAPDSFRDRLNYGLALLRAGDLKTAIAELEKAQQQDPALPHTWFNLGIAYKRERRYPDAIRQFGRMTQLVPDEPVSHYNLGLLYKLAGRSEEALKQFETAAKLDPRLVAPKFQIYNFYRLRDDEAAADRALKQFEEAKLAQQAAGETEDMDWCFYAELYDPSQAHPPARDTSAPPQLTFADRKLAGAADPKTAGMLVIDADGGGKPDLLVWSRRGVSLFRVGLDPVPNTGLETIRDVVNVAAGDFDNDGLADLCIVTSTGATLYRNLKGKFERVPDALPAGHYESALWLDFDHDYDLDLFLFGEQSRLLRNEGASGFRDYTAHFPFAPGRALSAAAFHAVPDSKGIDIAASYADRPGVLYRDQLRGIFEPSPLDAIPPNTTMLRAADVDNDGSMDLAFRTPRGISVALNRGARFQARPVPASGLFIFADLENRGLADLVSGDTVFRNQALAQFAKVDAPAGFPRPVALVQADFDSDGRADLATVAPDGSIHLLLNRTPTQNNWVRIALAGVKNVKTAASAEVEIKAGDHYQKQIYEGIPLLFGLGAHKAIDTVRISWPNGMVQNQPNEPAGRALALKEAPRLAGSCPMIFTWNGRSFQFITDVLGIAPLGASSGDGDYFPVDHDEYVSIPGEALAPRNGRYDIRITEELHEVSYLDQVQLIAVDHPATIDVYTNEKFKSPPFPEFRLFGVTKRHYPIAAHDDRGRDLRPAILARDGVYARGFLHNAAGVAQPHSITLNFGQVAREGNAVLLLNGWVDWADGSTFAAASQGGRSALVMPYLQVKDSGGNWRTVIDDMGIPAGKPKTIAVDLTGKFLSSSREVRISTNLCVYWDEIFLSEETAAPPVRLTGLAPASADLRLRGFSRAVIDPAREQPESFDYADMNTGAPWNQTPGLYTRYGDVRELVDAVDDKLVIMGAGDELRLEFDSRTLPPLAPAWRRDFLLLVDGWAKDTDANTAFSQTVEPLPFHAMTRYPYPPSEHFPNDAAHQAWRARYNTRPALRLVEPLTWTRGASRVWTFYIFDLQSDDRWMQQ